MKALLWRALLATVVLVVILLLLAGCAAPRAVTGRDVTELETGYAREFGFGPQERAAFHAGLEQILRDEGRAPAERFPAAGSAEEARMIRELVRGTRGKGERL